MLSGKGGKQKFYKNAKQEIISKPIEIEKSIKGQDIVLTIDSTIQFYSYKYLVEAIVKNKAKAGTVLVFDNLSGEILAIASYPLITLTIQTDQFKRTGLLLMHMS